MSKTVLWWLGLVAFAFLVFTCVGCGEGDPQSQAPFMVDLSPAAVAQSEFEAVVIVYPVVKNAGTDTASPTFLLTDTEAYVIPPADRQRLSHMPVGLVINCPRGIFSKWDKVRDTYGVPAAQALLADCSVDSEPNEDGVRSVKITSGPLTVGDRIGYAGYLAHVQHIRADTPMAPPPPTITINLPETIKVALSGIPDPAAPVVNVEPPVMAPAIAIAAAVPVLLAGDHR